MDPFSQAPDLQEVSGADACCCCCECVSDDVHLLCTRFDLHAALFVCWQQLRDLADLPCRLDLDVQRFPAVCRDLLHGFLQVRPGCSHEQEIIDISEIMLHPFDALFPAFLVKAAGDEVIQWRQVDVRKPRAGVVSDSQIPRILEQCFPLR